MKQAYVGGMDRKGMDNKGKKMDRRVKTEEMDKGMYNTEGEKGAKGG